MMPDLSVLLPLLALVAAIGALAGVLAGLLGIGGGIILVTAFFYAFETLGYGGDQLMQLCLGTSLATIVVTSARSVLAHHGRGAVDWAILRGWGPGIVVGSALGVLLAANLTSDALLALFGVLAMTVGLYMALSRPDWRLGAAMPTGALRAAIAPVIGFLSVLMGIGGGSFGVPLMTLHGVAIHRAVGTAAGFGALIAAPSVIGFFLIEIPREVRPPFTLGAVNGPAFLVVIAMTLLTAPLGARLAHALDPKPLKRIFAVFLILVAANMLRQAIAG